MWFNAFFFKFFFLGGSLFSAPTPRLHLRSRIITSEMQIRKGSKQSGQGCFCSTVKQQHLADVITFLMDFYFPFLCLVFRNKVIPWNPLRANWLKTFLKVWQPKRKPKRWTKSKRIELWKAKVSLNIIIF